MRKTFKVKGKVKSITKGKFRIFPEEFEEAIITSELMEIFQNSKPLSGDEYDVLIDTLYKNSTTETKIKGML